MGERKREAGVERYMKIKGWGTIKRAINRKRREGQMEKEKNLQRKKEG